MARKPRQKTPGVIERPKNSGKWYVRVKYRGKDRLHRVGSQTQGEKLHTRLRAEILEGRYQPERVRPITLKTWIDRCLEGTTNRDKQVRLRSRATSMVSMWTCSCRRPPRDVKSEILHPKRSNKDGDGNEEEATEEGSHKGHKER